MFDFPASPTAGQVYQPSAGAPAWQFDGTVWKSYVTSQGMRSPTRTLFTNSGTYNIPAGCTAYDVEVVGAGSGGGTASGASSAGTSRGGGGGGAGAYVKKLIQVTPAILAATKTITIGAAGAGVNGGSGNNGGTSSYTDGTNTLSAGGGAGGAAAGAGTQINFLYGGTGGSPSGGEVNVVGNYGQNGVGAGSVSVGANTSSASGGNGGAGPWGGGGMGAAASSASGASSTNGFPGVGYGAGGGGGIMCNAAAGTPAGGNGYQGVVIITEYYTGDPATAPGSGVMVETIITATQTYTKSAGLKYLEVEGQGCGGSGAPAIASAAGVMSFGSSGGAGSWVRALYPASAVPSSLTVTIGAAGASSSAGNGNVGGTSSFGSLITLPGGAAGQQGSNSTTFTSIAGSGASTAPTVSGTASYMSCQGPGSGYAAIWIGGVQQSILSPGGVPVVNGSLHFNGPVIASGNIAAINGTGYGWGGGGCTNGPSQALRPSGAGGPAMFRIREYF